ncbi:heterokaryon incompatibility protein-domain-containing protein [Biscogniauxia mediterranea]|nr:heterokaryon incompatibility protein-domain-containing protein [Biscogniauxia mediterranea]
MRLLNTENGELKEFIGNQIPSEYAILSHRWGDQEVPYRDWLRRRSCSDVRSRYGYQKIKEFCYQAKRDGMRWAWVDTCCIDKSSSQDLSEAINSMFSWYQNSSVCYAFLGDYNSDIFDASELDNCEWFLRGWTLQELIAPKRVDFFNKNWQYIGTKTNPEMCKAISNITKIDIPFLYGSDLEDASIAKRMSWASRRSTTRPEDVAYCLLGIFDINIPLLYGEGTKAFQRLQEEIVRRYPEDHSLYAWGIPVEKCSVEAEVTEDTSTQILDSLDNRTVSSDPLHGLLARSPRDFEFSRHYSPISWVSGFYYAETSTIRRRERPTTIGKSVQIELPIIEKKFYYRFRNPTVTQIRTGYYVRLLCKDDTDRYAMIWLPLLHREYNIYVRVGELIVDRPLHLFVPQHLCDIFGRTLRLDVEPERKYNIQNGDIVLRSVYDFRYPVYNFLPPRRGEHAANVLLNDFSVGRLPFADNVIQLRPDRKRTYTAGTFSGVHTASGKFQVILGRVDVEDRDLPAFQVGIIPDTARDPRSCDFVSDKIFHTPSDQVCFIIKADNTVLVIRVERRLLQKRGEFIDIVDIILKRPSPHDEDDIQRIEVNLDRPKD